MAKQLPQTSKKLNYSVHNSSGHSASYLPDNIRRNEPSDQASRWSSAANDQNQFLLLKLEKMAVMESIGFGKFHKVHVCNLKEFKVYAGPTLDNLHLILHTGLNNDTVPETFPPDYSLTGLPDHLPFPVQYIKIVPLAAWGSNFNFSIWYVELRGWDSNAELVKAALDEYNRTRELETTRLVLKFLRQHDHPAALAALQASSGVQLEAPEVTQLHQLISQNRLQEAENLLLELFNCNPAIFDQYLHDNVPYEAHWTRLDELITGGNGSSNLDENGNYKISNGHPMTASLMPSGRGGHQMLWDPVSQRLFLLGGWDGRRDLADFWSFDPVSRSWTLLCADVEREGGPSGRSCHKAALHSQARHIYILGRYIDPERRDPLNLPCDFYRYDLQDAKWTRLSSDVRGDGGPGCIYDHQMIVDEEEECLWVFGGRLLSGTNENSVYSGLYRYDLRSSQWTHIQPDCGSMTNSGVNTGVNCVNVSDTSTNTSGSSSSSGPLSLLPPAWVPSRIGHSMLFDPLTRSLLILSGQRYKDQLGDFYRYAVDRHSVTHICKNLQMAGGPEAGYTQRAAIDPISKEMFLFSCMLRNGGVSSDTSSPSAPSSDSLESSTTEPVGFWCFDLTTDRWTRIKTSGSFSPPPRFAHQLAYDPVNKTFFLFGGNPGNPTDPTARLSDFWCARLIKPQSPADILRRCQFLIRRFMFESLLNDLPSALHFLQTDLAAVVNHSDPIESIHFRSLSTKLFAKDSSNEQPIDLFSEIVKFLPKSLQPPINNL